MLAGGSTSDEARTRGINDYAFGVPVTRCPFPYGKERRAWVAGWHQARAEANQ